jgi:hypothetical protein
MPRSTAANPRAVTFTENIHSNRLNYQPSRPRRLDLFDDSDSDSDDDIPAAPEPVVPPAPADHVLPIIAPLIVDPVPHVPVLVPVAPGIDVPVQPFDMILGTDEDDEAGWSDNDAPIIPIAESHNVLPPPHTPPGSDYVPTDEDEDTPPASPPAGPRPPSTGRPVRESAIKSGNFNYSGLARTISTVTANAKRRFTAFTARVVPRTSQIGTPILNTAPTSATMLVPNIEPRTYKQAMSSSQSAQWQEAMEAELLSITTLKVFDSIPLPSYTRAIPFKWEQKINWSLWGSDTQQSQISGLRLHGEERCRR